MQQRNVALGGREWVLRVLGLGGSFFCLCVWFFFSVFVFCVFVFFYGQKKNLFAFTLLFVFLLRELGSLRCGVYRGFTPEALNFVGGSRRAGLASCCRQVKIGQTDAQE